MRYLGVMCDADLMCETDVMCEADFFELSQTLQTKTFSNQCIDAKKLIKVTYQW
jgi:hypothetical protein